MYYSIIRDEAAYDAAVRRNIRENARKGFWNRVERASEIVSFLSDEVQRAKPFELWVSFMGSYETFGKLSDKQVDCVLRAIDKRKAQQAERAAAFAEIAAKSNYVGEVGQKIEWTLTVEKVISFEGFYGLQFVYLMRDADGNRITTKTNRDGLMEQGSTVTVKGTIKAHEEYKGEKQTILTRVKVA